MKNEFERYFESNVNNGKEKLTLVLGSGFHKSNKLDNLLSSWGLLLKKLDPKFTSQGNYLLDFEKIIINNSSSLQAKQVEKNKLKEVAKFVKEVEDEIGIENLKQYPTDIFNPDFVSDIIILNFDEIAEKICKEVLKCKISNFEFVEIDKNLKKGAKIHQTTRYRDVIFPTGKSIRFWHPHGSISKPTEMILSIRNYATHIASIERLRKYSKSKNSTNIKKTWYSQLKYQSVLIVGASISAAEWDLWSAFVNRERNFSRAENIIYRKPIFQMRKIKDDDSKMSSDKNNEQWFKPLFDEQLSFEKQWEMLIKMFKV